MNNTQGRIQNPSINIFNTFDLHTFAKCPLLWHLKHTAFVAGHLLLAWIDRPQKVHNLITLDVASDTLSMVESVEDLSATVGC